VVAPMVQDEKVLVIEPALHEENKADDAQDVEAAGNI